MSLTIVKQCTTFVSSVGFKFPLTIEVFELYDDESLASCDILGDELLSGDESLAALTDKGLKEAIDGDAPSGGSLAVKSTELPVS